METYLHLQISQHQASLKHENFTLSYHSYTTLLPQNILQLQLHFSCRPTLYSISNLRFTKIRVSWNGELPLHQGCTVQPFAIAGRITFIYMKYGRHCVRVIFIRYTPLTTARANKLASNFLAINRQLLELGSCSNPLWIQQVF